MKDVVEIFFGLAVGLPLAIIGLIGALAIVLASLGSAATLFSRGHGVQAGIVLALVAMVALMAFDVVPAAGLAGVPLLGVAAAMTAVTHQRLARTTAGQPGDIPLAVAAAAGLVALMVPVFILLAGNVAG